MTSDYAKKLTTRLLEASKRQVRMARKHQDAGNYKESYLAMSRAQSLNDAATVFGRDAWPQGPTVGEK